jgi:cytosine/adenosine deaminase-related metal-dependent hydrolase
MPTSTLIRNAGWAVLWDAAAKQHVYGRDVDIVLRDGRIAAITPHADARVDADVTVIDGRRMLAMPGLVNVHTHPTTEPAYRGVREDHGVPEQHMSGLFERLQAFRLDAAGQQAAMRLAMPS